MKKLNMRFTLILSLFALLVFSSCSSDDPISPGGGNTTTSSIGGSISGVPNEIVILRATVNGNGNSFTYSDTLLPGGTFDIALTTPPANVLVGVNSITGGDTIFTINDTNAFVTVLSEIGVFDVSDTLLGTAIRRNFDDSVIVGSFIVQYFYSDRSTSITGTRIGINGSDTSTVVANINLVAGWNVVSTQQTVRRPNNSTIVVATGEPAGASWRFQSATLRPNRFFNNRAFIF